MNSEEKQIQAALDALHTMRRLAATIEAGPGGDAAISIAAEIESKIKAAALMIGKTITGTKLQAVVDGSTVTIVTVDSTTTSTPS